MLVTEEKKKDRAGLTERRPAPGCECPHHPGAQGSRAWQTLDLPLQSLTDQLRARAVCNCAGSVTLRQQPRV